MSERILWQKESNKEKKNVPTKCYSETIQHLQNSLDTFLLKFEDWKTFSENSESDIGDFCMSKMGRAQVKKFVEQDCKIEDMLLTNWKEQND